MVDVIVRVETNEVDVDVGAAKVRRRSRGRMRSALWRRIVEGLY